MTFGSVLALFFEDLEDDEDADDDDEDELGSDEDGEDILSYFCKKLNPTSPLPKKPSSGVLGKYFLKISASTLSFP